MRRVAALALLTACGFQGQGDPTPGLSDDTIEIDMALPIDSPPGMPPPDHPGGSSVITIGPVTELLEGFPVLVTIDASRIDYLAVTEPHTYLAFSKDGQTLPFDDEVWNPNGTSLVWVRVNRIDPTQSESITMYWGNDAKDRSLYAPADVWRDFESVWHMNGDGSLPDELGRHTGPANGTKRDENGKIGGARRFDGSDQSVVPFSQSADLFDRWTTFSLEMWLSPTDSLDVPIVAGEHRVMRKSTAVTNGLVSKPIAGTAQFDLDFTFGGNGNGNSSTSQVTAETPGQAWTYVAVSCDGTTLRTYVNGEMTQMSSCAMPLRDDNAIFQLGDTDKARAWLGAIDELRITRKPLTTVWIGTQFKSMRDMFLTIPTLPQQ